MERKLAGGVIGGRGRDERCRGRKTSAKGQYGNGWIGSEGMKRLGAGGRESGGWLRQGGSNASGRKKGRVQCVRTLTCASGGKKGRVQCVRTLSCASAPIGRGRFTSGLNEPGRTQPQQEFTL